MLDELRGARILDGVRGRPPVDRAAVAELIVRPVAAGRSSARTSTRSTSTRSSPRPDGAVAVDALVVLRDG